MRCISARARVREIKLDVYVRMRRRKLNINMTRNKKAAAIALMCVLGFFFFWKASIFVVFHFCSTFTGEGKELIHRLGFIGCKFVSHFSPCRHSSMDKQCFF